MGSSEAITALGIHPAVFFIALVWTMIWKGIGLWKAGRQNQIGWFVAMFILPTLGILPIIYLLWFQKKGKRVKKSSRKKK